MIGAKCIGLIVFVGSLSLLQCSSKEKSENKNNSNPNIEVMDKDSISFEIVKTKLKENNNFNDESSFHIVKFLFQKELLDFLIIEEINSICKSQYVAVILKNQIRHILLIMQECDTELSNAEFESYDYEIINDSTFHIIKYIERVSNPNLIDSNGFLIEGISREDIKGLVYDTIHYHVNIMAIPLRDKSWPGIILPDNWGKVSE